MAPGAVAVATGGKRTKMPAGTATPASDGVALGMDDTTAGGSDDAVHAGMTATQTLEREEVTPRVMEVLISMRAGEAAEAGGRYTKAAAASTA